MTFKQDEMKEKSALTFPDRHNVWIQIARISVFFFIYLTFGWKHAQNGTISLLFMEYFFLNKILQLGTFKGGSKLDIL